MCDYNNFLHSGFYYVSGAFSHILEVFYVNSCVVIIFLIFLLFYQKVDPMSEFGRVKLLTSGIKSLSLFGKVEL